MPMHVLLSLLLVALAAPVQDPLRETQVSTPEVVRTEYDMPEVVTPPPLAGDALAGWKLFVQRVRDLPRPAGAALVSGQFRPPAQSGDRRPDGRRHGP